MAKKKATPKGQLGDWLDAIPEEVQEAADAYDKAHSAKSKAKGKLNTARDVPIEKIRSTRFPRFASETVISASSPVRPTRSLTRSRRKTTEAVRPRRAA